MIRPDYRQAIETTGILDHLAPFAPRIVGTPPLGVDTQTSDIDILCHAPDDDCLGRLTDGLWSAHRHRTGFRLWQWTSQRRPLLASFRAEGWEFEIFTDRIPVEKQAGSRHFEVERRLLAIGGAPFRAAVMLRRLDGMKTEPAFWSALQRSGDPYAGMLALYGVAHDDLAAALREAGFEPAGVPT